MSLDWRTTLKSLLPAFESLGAKHLGLNHLLIEEVEGLAEGTKEPPWFSRHSVHNSSQNPSIDEPWSVRSISTTPGHLPGFRAPFPGETIPAGSKDAIWDISGVLRAVPFKATSGRSHFCGGSVDSLNLFRSLANAAATALTGAVHLEEHHLASELSQLFHQPRYGIRYVFGDVPNPPRQFISQAWNAGILRFDHGVLIDMPVAETKPDSRNWMLLVHRLAWRQYSGSGLRATRNSWGERMEASYDSMQFRSPLPSVIQNSVFPHRYYSVLGSKESPLDVSLASALAIHILLAELDINAQSKPKTAESPLMKPFDGTWYESPSPNIATVEFTENLKQKNAGMIAIIVATEVEKKAVLQKLRSLDGEASVLQCFEKKNTFYLGRLGLQNIVLCMTSMGSSGRDSSALVTAETIQTWKVAAVIMVGIAFGKDSEKQEIGRVLVSDQIIPYEPKRIGETQSQPRGVTQQAGTILLNRFRNVVGWRFESPEGEESRFQVGPLLSGEKLVDNLQFKQELFCEHPTAIGGEMEGAGLAAAATRNGNRSRPVRMGFSKTA